MASPFFFLSIFAKALKSFFPSLSVIPNFFVNVAHLSSFFVVLSYVAYGFDAPQPMVYGGGAGRRCLFNMSSIVLASREDIC